MTGYYPSYHLKETRKNWIGEELVVNILIWQLVSDSKLSPPLVWCNQKFISSGKLSFTLLLCLKYKHMWCVFLAITKQHLHNSTRSLWDCIYEAPRFIPLLGLSLVWAFEKFRISEHIGKRYIERNQILTMNYGNVHSGFSSCLIVSGVLPLDVLAAYQRKSKLFQDSLCSMK